MSIALPPISALRSPVSGLPNPQSGIRDPKSTPAPAVPPVQRRRTVRELSRALWLRPRDIYELYGLSPSMLCDLANHAEASRRPPSRLIHGRGQKKGVRIFNRAEFEAWLARWSSAGDFCPASTPDESKKTKRAKPPVVSPVEP